MEVMADAIYRERYAGFQTVLEALETQDIESAQERLEALSIAQTENSQSTSISEANQILFFKNALECRLNGDSLEESNLYLLADNGQQIETFNFMAQRFPVIRFAQELVNQTYVSALKAQAHLTVWDIGVGSGQQMVRLIESVVAVQKQTAEQSLTQVTILGLDPSAASLSQAEKALAECCQKHQLAFHFEAFPCTIESLTPEDWLRIQTQLKSAAGQWIANASFALHHITPVDLRATLFERIHAMRPLSFCLIEPFADFLEDNLKTRFDNAWHHYGLTFWAIDQIDAPEIKKNQLKSVFFGREILDVLSKDAGRIEQFETGEMWTRRLLQSGYQVNPVSTQQHHIPDFESIGIEQHSHFTALTAQGYPIISILEAHLA